MKSKYSKSISIQLIFSLIFGHCLARAEIGRGYRQQYLQAGQEGSFYSDPFRFQVECLAQHNKWRSIHNSEPLSFDAKLTAYAQRRANTLARSGSLWHEGGSRYGENLAWHSWPATSCSTLIKMWHDELYRVRHLTGSSRSSAAFVSRALISQAGHFSQLVWRQSRRVGCARAFGPGRRGGVYLVCTYDPPGNVIRNGY